MSPQDPDVPEQSERAPQQPPAPQAGGQGEAPEPAVTDPGEGTTGIGETPTVEQFDAVAAERDGFLDQLQRKHAELENFRKQSQKRLADEGARALAAFAERMLPVLDAIEAAQAHGSTDIDAVATNLIGFLEKEGLERVSPTGEAFDPNVAEAVMHDPGEGDGGPIVTEVLRTGYLWNGRVIRAAMVKVAG